MSVFINSAVNIRLYYFIAGIFNEIRLKHITLLQHIRLLYHFAKLHGSLLSSAEISLKMFTFISDALSKYFRGLYRLYSAVAVSRIIPHTEREGTSSPWRWAGPAQNTIINMKKPPFEYRFLLIISCHHCVKITLISALILGAEENALPWFHFVYTGFTASHLIYYSSVMQDLPT